VIDEHNQKVIRIPGDCWHGFKAISDEPAFLINYPTTTTLMKNEFRTMTTGFHTIGTPRFTLKTAATD
jgi:dTDP-4-dehydrorhamnose 3,5-epimerase-like enzyme